MEGIRKEEREKRGCLWEGGRKGSEAKERVEVEWVEEVFVHVQVLRGSRCRHHFNQSSISHASGSCIFIHLLKETVLLQM